MKWKEIAEFFNYSNHSGAIWARNKVQFKMEVDRAYFIEISELKTIIENI